MKYYIVNITGLSEETKKFIMDSLPHIHGYQWLVNLDDTPNPNGEHYIYVRGKSALVWSIIAQAGARFSEGTIDARVIDPDEKQGWERFSIRERFEEQYKRLPAALASDTIFGREGETALDRLVRDCNADLFLRQHIVAGLEDIEQRISILKSQIGAN